MKNFDASKRFLLITLLVALYIFVPSFSSAALFIERIVVTDVTGHQERLTDPQFLYSDHHENEISGYLEIMLTGSPRRSLWVHHSQIKIATFRDMKNGVGISVTTDGGEIFSGMFPDAQMKISGKGDLGQVTYAVAKIKSLEFIQFREWERLGIDRQQASAEWKKSQEANVRVGRGRFREKKEEKKVAKKKREGGLLPSPSATALRWTIVDGKRTIDAKGLGIRDSYNSNRSGFMIYYGRSFRRSSETGNVTVERGASQANLSLTDLESLEITGGKIGDKPEMIIEKKDGSKFTVALLLTKQGDEPVDYGPPEEDDMLIWNTPYGIEGVSLMPIRKITIRAQKETKMKDL